MSGCEKNMEETKYLVFDVNYTIILWYVNPPLSTGNRLISPATYINEIIFMQIIITNNCYFCCIQDHGSESEILIWNLFVANLQKKKKSTQQVPNWIKMGIQEK